MSQMIFPWTARANRIFFVIIGMQLLIAAFISFLTASWWEFTFVGIPICVLPLVMLKLKPHDSLSLLFCTECSEQFN